MKNRQISNYKLRLLLVALFCLLNLSAYLTVGIFGKPEKVAKLRIGETYVAYREDGTIQYVKLVDKKRIIYVEDLAHMPMKHYQGDGDDKSFGVTAGSYRREKADFVQDRYSFYRNLFFTVETKVKPGVKGEILNLGIEHNGRIGKFQSGVSIDRDHGYYHLGSVYYRRSKQNTPNSVWDNSVGWLQVSKVKLPDTPEAFTAQYKLSKRKY